MYRLLIAMAFLSFLSCMEKGKPEIKQVHTIYSKAIGDSFTIELRLPPGFDKDSAYTVIYIPDASLGLGTYVLGKDSSWRSSLPNNCVIAAIGHSGNTDMKRQRDFIPSDEGGYNNNEFGRADRFYGFLKNDILPLVAKLVPRQHKKVFIGHSFSGLFSLYAALQNDSLFDEYFAISPSVWASHHQLLKIEEAFSKTNKKLDARIHIYAGGLEVFNKVLSSSKKIYTTMQARGYEGFSISFESIPYTNHFSVRKPAIDKILNALAN